MLNVNKTKVYPVTTALVALQVCSHLGVDIDPDSRDDVGVCAEALQLISTFIRNHMPGVATKPSITESCIYTVH